MRTFGQSVRIGTGGRARAGCFVRRHEQVAQPHPSVQFLIERDGMGGAGRRQDQRTVFRGERAEVFPVQSCGALSVESDRADRGIAAQQFVYAVRLLVADVAVEASFPLALSADIPQRDARVEQHGFPQRVVFGQFPVAQPCHDRPECVARVTVILSFCERHRARHRARARGCACRRSVRNFAVLGSFGSVSCDAGKRAGRSVALRLPSDALSPGMDGAVRVPFPVRPAIIMRI